MSDRKGIGLEIDVGDMGLPGLLGFILGVGIPLALCGYVFFGQIITMDLLNDVKDAPCYNNPSKKKELNEIYASNIIVLVLTGGALLSGAYVLGSGIVSLSSGSMFLNIN
jgi:hypothetical protein